MCIHIVMFYNASVTSSDVIYTQYDYYYYYYDVCRNKRNVDGVVGGGEIERETSSRCRNNDK